MTLSIYAKCKSTAKRFMAAMCKQTSQFSSLHLPLPDHSACMLTVSHKGSRKSANKIKRPEQIKTAACMN